MPFKINISNKQGKTYHFELENEEIIGKKLHDIVAGNELLPDLSGYELEIAGASDKAGFTAMENVEGVGLKKLLLTYGKGMRKKPRKEGKKKLTRNKPKGLRLRKTVRGNTISKDIVQINMAVVKEGQKKLSEIFPEQSRGREEDKKETEAKEEKQKDKREEKTNK